MDFIKGEVLYFDKPYTWTSFNLVAKVRWTLCKKLGIKKLKVGHAGTLDPEASGVLPIMVGKAARLFDYMQDKEKALRALSKNIFN